MAPPLRIGLLGYGFGGRWFHAPLLASAPGCELVGVVTRSPERRALVERDRPGTAVLDSLQALAGAGAEAVAVSTPVATHAALVAEAADLGLHVVCDKPLAPDAATARAACGHAQAAGVLLGSYQNRRWDSDFLTARRLVGSGALGDLVRLESRFERFAPDPGPAASGGGALLDLGSHLVDQALLLGGPVERVWARLHVRPDLDGRDDDATLALVHAGGLQSLLRCSWTEGAPGPRLRVSGSTGTFVVDGVDGQEEALLAGRTPAGEGARWGLEPRRRWGRVVRGGAPVAVEPERGRWDTYYPAFAAAVRGQGPLPVDPWDSVAALDVLDAARRSAHEGEVVRLGPGPQEAT